MAALQVVDLAVGHWILADGNGTDAGSDYALQTFLGVVAAVGEGQVGCLARTVVEYNLVGGRFLGGCPLEHLVAIIGCTQQRGCDARPIGAYVVLAVTTLDRRFPKNISSRWIPGSKDSAS